MTEQKKSLNIAAAKERQAKEDAGAWMQYSEGGEFLISYSLNPTFLKRLDRLTRSRRSQLGLSQKKDKPLPQEHQDDVLCEAMAGSIVLDWRGLEDGDGNAVPFSEEACKQLLLDLRQLRIEVNNFATERDGFHANEVEEAAGN